MKTRVIFRKFRREGDIIALFPHEPGTDDPGTMQCYQHLGQHGTIREAHVPILTETAAPSKYSDLLAELRGMGYTDLEVRMNLTSRDYAIRKDAIERQTLPNSQRKQYTVIGVYLDWVDDRCEGFTGHVVARNAAEAIKFAQHQSDDALTIVDVIAGHHMSLMEGR